VFALAKAARFRSGEVVGVDRHKRTAILMLATFGVVCVLLIVLEQLESAESNETRERIDLIEHNALVSTRIAGQIEAAVDRERILIDRHVFEVDATRIEQTERQLAAVRAQYDDCAKRYAPLATFPGEAEAWLRLTNDVAAMRRAAEPALQASRENKDELAMSTIESNVDPLLDKIGTDVTALVEINQTAAARTVDDLARVHRVSTRARLAFVLAIIGVVAVGGAWVTRLVVRAQRQLAEANRELDAFAGRVAHDLRNPLNSISLAGSVLADMAPQAHKMTTAIDNGVKRMTNVVDDLLALSRAGTRQRAATAIEPVVASLEPELRRLVEDAGGTLRLELEPARVACGEGLLRQVLWNLGENAVKYRRPDAALSIEIAGRVERRAYLLTVHDNGRGMEPDEVRRAFEPLFRGTRVSSIPGTGLGLAIVRRIVEASGGRVALESAPERGSTFRITLRLA
jgi:signal transduction histidine kinase